VRSPTNGTSVAPTLDYVQMYGRHWQPLLHLAQSLVDDPATAEDVVQESFAALFTKDATLRDDRAAVAYLRTCVVNGARSALRRRQTVRARLHLVHDTEYAPSADEPTLRNDERKAVRTTLSTLPRRQREVLGLRFLCDLDDREIAEVTGMSHANVRSAASRGLTALRAALEGGA
jgi:RNA polymerase sigma factor (sigma-70 family)